MIYNKFKKIWSDVQQKQNATNGSIKVCEVSHAFLETCIKKSADQNAFFDESLAKKLSQISENILKQNMALNWKVIDLIDSTKKRDSSRTCPLCDAILLSDLCKYYESHCIFGGGLLKRYQCYECDLIFGPDKMFDMTKEQLSDDYGLHYQIYEEGDSTENEIRTFHALSPVKDGVYLNYGCGNSSQSIKVLRDEGWQVFGFEPHSRDNNAIGEGMLSHADLEKILFDGIFSNNVLEHFYEPIDELTKLKMLLKPNGKMSHTTPCFEYAYPYTRFHLFFFTGRSAEILFEKAGLRVLNIIKDGEFINYLLENI